jgi:acyl carrier protein phosphodiesterase
VNFFGHAAVASWIAPHSGSVLGAMLPDFATMSRARLAAPSDQAVAHGIALHHRTDGAFHHLPPVLALMRELDDRLERAGCARGPRRAVAHIGVELLLDGVLVDDATYCDHYLAGLAHDPAGVHWRDDGDDARFALLLSRLRSHGVPDDLRRTEAITTRLHRMLAHRPLLAPSASDLVAIKSSLAAHQQRVEVATDTVLRGLRAALSVTAA